MSSARLDSPTSARLRSLLLAAALVVSVSCKLQEPQDIDGLDPEPTSDSLVITPQNITVPTGDSIAFVAPDEAADGTPLSGAVEWTVSGAGGATISTTGLFRATAVGDYTVQARRSGHTGRSRARVTATTATLTGVKVAPDVVTLQPGTTFTFVANGVMSDGATVPITPTWSATGGSITSAGVYTAGTTAGQFRVVVKQQGGTFADTARVTISATPPSLQAVVVTPANVSLSPGGSQQFSAVGRLTDGSSSSVVVTWTATGGSVTSSGRYTAGSTAGGFRVIATEAGGKADTSAVTVTPPAPTLTGVEVTPTSVNLAPGSSQQFSAIGRMSNGGTSSVTVSWSAAGGSITSGGAYTAGANGGTFRVIASSGAFADTASVTIAVPPPTVTLTAIVVTPGSASLLTGATQQFSAVGRMSDNSTSGVTVTWSATGGTVSGSGLYTAGGAPGTYRIIAVEQGGTKADTSSITVSAPAPTLAAVVIAPSSVSLQTSESQQFSAVGRMSDGSTEGVSVNWTATGGTVNAAGAYVAGGTPGTFRVIATRQGGTEADTASVTITLPPPTIVAVELTPSSVTLAPGEQQQFAVVGRMSDGSTSAVSVNYSETGGSITAGGRYTAGSTPGTYQVIAVRQGDSKADTSVVTITAPAPTLSAVEVTPTSATLGAGATQQFTALGRMSDGSATTVSVNWSETGGTISAGGLYTAGSTAGSFRVIAVQQGGTRADTANVTITAAAPTLTAVEVTPATATLAAGATQQFTAVGRMSDNSTTSVTVTWSAAGGAITTGGLFTAGSVAGSYRVIAVQQGGTEADTSTVTVTSAPPPPPPSNGTADPSLLPSVTSQVKDVAAYTALNVRAMAAGGSYTDPVTGVRVWKVTSATVPMSNPGSGHDYSEGPVQVSREWGGNKHTLLVRVDYGGYWLVDLTRGSGLSNWRQLSVAPRTTSGASFSQNPATPQILFVVTNSGITRVNTATNSAANTGNFPASIPMLGWLTQDKQDVWFVGQGTTSGSVVAWNSQTNELRTKTFSGLDEPYFDRDGRYVFANVGSTSSTIWDLQTNTTGSISAPGNSSFFHMPGLRGFFMTTDVNTGAGKTPLWRVDPSSAHQNAEVSTLGGYSPDAHAAGQWVQEDSDLPGGDRTKQWFLRSTFNMSYTATGNGAKEALAFIRADGSDFRLLAHHYSTFSGSLPADPFKYWSMPRATPSPDGKVVLFDSNMLAGAPARYDLFVAEVPLR